MATSDPIFVTLHPLIEILGYYIVRCGTQDMVLEDGRLLYDSLVRPRFNTGFSKFTACDLPYNATDS
jgi:hypothetical protein